MVVKFAFQQLIDNTEKRVSDKKQKTLHKKSWVLLTSMMVNLGSIKVSTTNV